MSYCTQRNEFTLNILLLQSTVIRNVNCTNAHPVSLSAWLGDTLILRRTILIEQLIVFMFHHPTNERGQCKQNVTVLFFKLHETVIYKRNHLNKHFNVRTDRAA